MLSAFVLRPIRRWVVKPPVVAFRKALIVLLNLFFSPPGCADLEDLSACCCHPLISPDTALGSIALLEQDCLRYT